ncbi:MAG: MXAN_5187 C-terminal domain-containing protein [Polyangiaceae bacterium]
MDADELDIQINELEHRLDRLRALYEQYFLGIEKIEPQVARKDVDRRFWALRKIKIRNTARRFKLQTLIQRYNTFQQHWGRICREIENGTYKRQMLRAERRLGSDATSASPDSRRSERAIAAESARDAAENDLAALMDGDLDLAAEAKRALEAVMKPAPPRQSAFPSEPPTAPKIPAAKPAALDKLELDDFDLDPQPARRSAPPVNRLTPVGAVPAARPATARPAPPVSGAAAPRPQATAPRPPAPAANRPVLSPGAQPPGRPPAPAHPAPPAVRPAPPAARPAPPAARPAPPAPPAAAPPVRPASPARPAGQPAISATTRPTPEAKPGPAKAPAQPVAQAGRPIRSAVGGSARASEIFGGPLAPRAAAAPAAARPSSGSSGLSEDRVKAVHAKLMAAKKQLNEQSGVSVGGLKKQLDASYQKLQAKHRGKQIDFDVVVKDGKAVVKPKIR